jgi:hypothetical protein
MKESKGNKRPDSSLPNQSGFESRDGRQSQSIVSKAIELYVDRHNFNFSDEGAKDLNLLSTCNPATLFKQFQSSPETGLPASKVE